MSIGSVMSSSMWVLLTLLVDLVGSGVLERSREQCLLMGRKKMIRRRSSNGSPVPGFLYLDEFPPLSESVLPVLFKEG